MVQLASMKQLLFSFLFLALFVACGYSKELNGDGTPHPIPELQPREKVKIDPSTKVLKPEHLKLSQNEESLQPNLMQIKEEGRGFSLFRKSFGFPIQFNGSVSLEQVSLNFQNCDGQAEVKPHFYLQSDHRTQVEMKAGEKYPVRLERLYVIRVEFDNAAKCASADLQFAVVYGE